jgi:hypothetical protein
MWFLWVVLYFVVAAIFGGACVAFEWCDEDSDLVWMTVFWPVTFPVTLTYRGALKLGQIIKDNLPEG